MQKYKKENVIILIVVLLKTIIHLIADAGSGFDGDEIYHIDTGRHLAMGYMEFPPMIAFVAWVQNLFNSDSVYAHHLFVHLFAALIIVFCGLTIIRLGGRWKSLLLCFACMLTAPCFGLSQNTFQPVIFDQFFWILSFYMTISYIKTNRDTYLILLGVSLGLGFLAKYSILFFIVSLAVLVLRFRPGLLKKRVFWLTVCIFFLIILPNVYWQFSNHWPEIEHASRLYEKQLQQYTRLDNLKFLIISLNPITLFVWLTGLCVVPFISLYRNFRIGLLVGLLSFILMFIGKGKSYYFLPLILMAFISGSVFIEHLLTDRKWLFTSYLVLLFLMMPFALIVGLPLLSREQYIKFLHIKKNESGVTPIIIDAYSCGETWIKLNEKVKKVYLSLPVDYSGPN
jgi:4-amino-4-deoxy-L-arabinose transferase-like glycosyltransferase